MRSSFFLVFTFISTAVFAQEYLKDDVVDSKEKRLQLNLDVVSRYLWRGQCWGGNYIAIQPSVEYKVSSKLTLGFWATTNFKNDYFYPDGMTSYKGYQETDFYVAYQFNNFLELQAWDYYWPSVSRVEGINNSFFNYGNNGVKTVDVILYFDFSEGYKYPFNVTLSTLIAGNDYRYDNDGEHPKQNYTTYLELGYNFTLFEKAKIKIIKSTELSPVLGAVLNNKGKYYASGDYNQVSFVNIGLKAVKEIDLGNGINMPFFISFTHNAAKNNTQIFGKNFIVAGISFNY